MRVPESNADLSRLSLNQVTTRRWGLREAVEGCVAADVPIISPWRDKVAEIGLPEAARILRESGLRVHSLHIGGDFPGATEAERRASNEDNRRAIEEVVERERQPDAARRPGAGPRHRRRPGDGGEGRRAAHTAR